MAQITIELEDAVRVIFDLRFRMWEHERTTYGFEECFYCGAFVQTDEAEKLNNLDGRHSAGCYGYALLKALEEGLEQIE